jgi:hypothetical protein
MCCGNIVSLLWESQDTYIELLEKFGMPDILDPDKGGGAIWNIQPHKIMLFDQKIDTEPDTTVHITTPIKLFACINPQTVKVSEQGRERRIASIIGILPKYISYDPVAETITTRFYNAEIAFYLTMLCMKITTGELNQNDARSILADSLGSPIDTVATENYINEYHSVCVF